MVIGLGIALAVTIAAPLTQITRSTFGEPLLHSTRSLRLSRYEKVPMKQSTAKFETSTLVSNLMLGCAVIAAMAPMLLGDRLALVVSSTLSEGTILLQSLSLSLQRLLS